MSNMGLELFLKERGLDLIRTQVGDRYVVERMRADGYNVGGEQSGHVVLGDHATTGDGLIAALQVLAALISSRSKASQALRLFEPLPQILKNVRLSTETMDGALADQRVKAAIAEGEKALDGTGRLLIRKSGTEPLVRVMAEGKDQAQVEGVVNHIVEAVRLAGGVA
jgi:phosphoglucosamine mutase